MRNDRTMWLDTPPAGAGPRPVGWRGWLLLIGWLAPLVLWVAVLALLKFNTGVASKAILLTTAATAVLTAFIRRHRPACVRRP